MRISLPLSVLIFAGGASAQWHQVTPASSPSARLAPHMAFDSANDRTVLFGGTFPGMFSSTYFNDTWTWNGLNWQQQSPTVSPAGRFFGGMAYDAVRGVTVLYGGETSSFIGPNYFDDTWEYDGTTWTQISTVNTPGALMMSSGVAEVGMAYDLIGQRTVLFGGEVFGGFVPAPNFTLEYDGVNWTQTTPTLSPSARAQASLCSAPSLGGVLLFGGTNFNNPPGPLGQITWNDTWVYASATNTWTNITPTTGPLPGPRAGASMLYDASLGVYVMNGGYMDTPQGAVPLADTWTFNGTTWTDVTATLGSPTSPLVRFASAEGPGCNVLFGGASGFFGGASNNTWILGCLAAANSYGQGCTGSAGVPSLAANNLPAFGAAFALAAGNLSPASSFAFMTLGFSNTTSLLGPLPVNLQQFGLGAGCNLLVSADITLLFAIAGGAGTFTAAIPSNAGFAGFPVYYQAGSLDAGATGGIAVSNAVAGRIGY